MDRRNFNKLFALIPIAFLPKPVKRRIFYPSQRWIRLTDAQPENQGYQLGPNWEITYPDGTKYDLSWAISFSDEEAEKEKQELIDHLINKGPSKTIIHQIHCRQQDINKILIVYKFDIKSVDSFANPIFYGVGNSTFDSIPNPLRRKFEHSRRT